ncbi:MAG: hypothetical protein KMY53_16070 [Desulfarculus sp.]|nr:hypothetical protein [Pseudomonadota bacterium]MBV1715468.1 hypothetical protein [Desulfarculus sp.]MBU4576226.1 hypothetical protein [Pseudomonadota bacterium]MBU4599264.1 hypothetical protein [Pseudomonadota bacterium]MBV1739685.1 hypothetical protein [Desulfarculus sp.]
MTKLDKLVIDARSRGFQTSFYNDIEPLVYIYKKGDQAGAALAISFTEGVGGRRFKKAHRTDLPQERPPVIGSVEACGEALGVWQAHQ